MSGIVNSKARAVADLAEGYIRAGVEIAALPERVFRALSSKEIVNWWVRPGVFRTTEWIGDARERWPWVGDELQAPRRSSGYEAPAWRCLGQGGMGGRGSTPENP